MSQLNPNHFVPQTGTSKTDIVISWVGLPAYGAHLIRAGINTLGQPVTVIATRPGIPIKGMEDILGQKVNWIDGENVKSWREIGLPMPNIFFQVGWYSPSLNSLGKEVRNSGGKVVALVDNCWKNNTRQWMGAIKYRLLYKKWFSAVWVPGESGAHLFRIFGVDSSQVFKGLYGSDPNCFYSQSDLNQRPKHFIFVGQFIPRKGIATLARAFGRFHKEFPEWKLLTYGAGECQSMLENCSGIEVHPFAQPAQIAEALRKARFLVLPSREDHWALVVSEATRAGCGLILSNKIGSRFDLLNTKNGFVFPARSPKKLAERLKQAALLPPWRLGEVHTERKRLGSLYGPKTWAETFEQIISQMQDTK